MVEILLHVFLHKCIAEADGLAQVCLKLPLNALRLAIFQCLAKTIQCLSVLFHVFFKQIDNLHLEDFTNLFVWYRQMKLPSLRFSPLCQVSCRKQQTPEILNRAVHILIRQFLVDFLCDFLTCHQFFNLHLCGTHIRHLNKTSDRVITAGVAPVILWLRLRVGTKQITVINHIPRAIHVNRTKTIAVIPFSNSLIIQRLVIICQHLPDFFVCKSKVLIKSHIRNGQYPQIIQPRKNTLL